MILCATLRQNNNKTLTYHPLLPATAEQKHKLVVLMIQRNNLKSEGILICCTRLDQSFRQRVEKKHFVTVSMNFFSTPSAPIAKNKSKQRSERKSINKDRVSERNVWRLVTKHFKLPEDKQQRAESSQTNALWNQPDRDSELEQLTALGDPFLPPPPLIIWPPGSNISVNNTEGWMGGARKHCPSFSRQHKHLRNQV